MSKLSQSSKQLSTATLNDSKMLYVLCHCRHRTKGSRTLKPPYHANIMSSWLICLSLLLALRFFAIEYSIHIILQFNTPSVCLSCRVDMFKLSQSIKWLSSAGQLDFAILCVMWIEQSIAISRVSLRLDIRAGYHATDHRYGKFFYTPAKFWCRWNRGRKLPTAIDNYLVRWETGNPSIFASLPLCHHFISVSVQANMNQAPKDFGCLDCPMQYCTRAEYINHVIWDCLKNVDDINAYMKDPFNEDWNDWDAEWLFEYYLRHLYAQGTLDSKVFDTIRIPLALYDLDGTRVIVLNQVMYSGVYIKSRSSFMTLLSRTMRIWKRRWSHQTWCWRIIRCRKMMTAMTTVMMMMKKLSPSVFDKSGIKKQNR